MFKERNHCRTEKVEGTRGRFLYFALIPHRTPVHVYVRTRSASLTGTTLRNLHLIKTHVDTNENRIKSQTIFYLKEQYLKNHLQQVFKLHQPRTLPIITQSRTTWYKPEAECNTALACFAMSPPCPSSSSCFHRKVAELLALKYWGKSREIAAQPAQPFLLVPGHANAAPRPCWGHDCPRCHFPAAGSQSPSLQPPVPSPCRQHTGAAGWKHRARHWLSCSSTGDMNPLLLGVRSGEHLGIVQGLCWKSTLFPTKASFGD